VYEAWYGLTEKPFNLTPDPKYLFLSRRHAEAFAHLEFGQRERGGFILLTGEVGAGKTTLARYFLGRLPDNTATAVVVYPALTASELLRSILEDLHVESESTSLKDLVDALHVYLLETRAQGRNVILLIDEAQALAAEVLEQVRLISNLETDTEKLIQIVLLGQSELRELLSRRDLRQLAQRVTARYHLDGLSRAETEEYVRHRLAVAGGEGKLRFTLAALNHVHETSSGIPRVINLVCDRALLAGYVAATRTITAEVVRQAAEEVRGEEQVRRRAPRRLALLGLGLAVAASLAFALGVPRTLHAPITPAASAPPPVDGPAAEAAPPPSVPTPVPPPPRLPRSERLEAMVMDADRLSSFRTALGRVEGLWGPPSLERTTLRTNLEQLRQLDLPAVLEMFHPARRDTCFLALLGLSGEEALVSIGDGAALKVPASQLDQLWTREAVFPWRDAQNLNGDRRRAEVWAGETLSRLGYARGATLEASLQEFQRDSRLVADGMIGSRTLMMLYSRGAEPRPRLKTAGVRS
jgi:general secretion pathway protein A